MDHLGFGHGEKTLSELRQNLINGAIVPNTPAFTQCESDFSLVDCQRVNASVSASNLSHLQEIIPISCSHVFETSSASQTSPGSLPAPNCP